MDENLDMDDLFGDTTPLALSAAPISSRLLQRVDEMRLNGCCQRLAWSKMGCIAYVTRDGRRVKLRTLHCSPEDGQWSLSQDCLVKQLEVPAHGNYISHLEWNHQGSELAVVDSLGRLSIITIFLSTNRASLSRPSVLDPYDTLNAIVGMMWLNIEGSAPLYRPAIKQDNRWVITASQHKRFGPFNPGNGSAVISFTKGGTLRLIFKSVENCWQAISSEAGQIVTTDDLYTHAALCTEKGNTILLATHSFSKQLRLYRISIDWKIAGDNKQKSPDNIPTLSIENLKVKAVCLPLSEHENPHDPMPSKISQSQLQLSHLHVIPSGPETRNREPTYPTVMASYSNLSSKTQFAEEASTVVSRWELRHHTRRLHQSFEQLTTKNTSIGGAPDLKTELSLSRMNDVYMNNKILISINLINLSTVIAVTYSDGSREMRDRSSMDLLPRDDHTLRASSLEQIGFAMADPEPCLHSDLSPNACMAICLGDSYEPKLKTLQYLDRMPDEAISETLMDATAAACTILYCLSYINHRNNDDILAFLQVFKRSLNQMDLGADVSASKSMDHSFLDELCAALGIVVDYSMEPPNEKLFKNEMLRRCLSVQASLGYNGEQKHRNLTAKLAWTILNLRATSITLGFAYKLISDSSGTDVSRVLTGLSTWAVDLMNFITDELFTLSNALRPHDTISRDLLILRMRELNSPALLLILNSSSRAFLRFNCRSLRGVHSTAQKPHPTGSEQAYTYQHIRTMFETAPVRVLQFERILAEIDNSIKKAYAGSITDGVALNEDQRRLTEKEMLLAADIPKILVPVAVHLLTITLDNLKNEIDAGELFFKDISWLALSDDRRSDQYRREHVIDNIRKVVLDVSKAGGKFRRCTRCCAITEDTTLPVAVSGPASSWSQIMSAQKCICGNLWMIVGEEED